MDFLFIRWIGIGKRRIQLLRYRLIIATKFHRHSTKARQFHKKILMIDPNKVLVLSIFARQGADTTGKISWSDTRILDNYRKTSFRFSLWLHSTCPSTFQTRFRHWLRFTNLSWCCLWFTSSCVWTICSRCRGKVAQWRPLWQTCCWRTRTRRRVSDCRASEGSSDLRWWVLPPIGGGRR